MSLENFERFRELVLQDLSLQEQLREFTEGPVFIQKVVELSAKRGFEITAEDVVVALLRNRAAWMERWI